MTFQVTLDERLEGQRLYARSRNRFWKIMPIFVISLILLVAVAFWTEPSWPSAICLSVMVGAACYDWVWEPYNIKRKFRRRCGGDITPPITYEFSPEGFVWKFSTGEQKIPWSQLKRRIEGKSVWIFVVNAKKPFFLVLPRRAIESDEGQAEWAIVDAAFASSPTAPIAEPR